MAALVAAIHVAPPHGADMDARIKSAHDEWEWPRGARSPV